jgi:ferritin
MPEINKNVTKEFNKQIQEETYSAWLYYSMAAWFEGKNLTGFAMWLKVQALEEMTHAHRFYHHIIDRLGEVELLEIAKPPKEWDSPLAAFEAAYKHEVHITNRIHHLMKLVRDEGDFSAEFGLLNWFETEQIEEEQQTDAIAQKLRTLGDSKDGLILLDKELGIRTFIMPVDLVL